jgi:hypothetical protein
MVREKASQCPLERRGGWDGKRGALSMSIKATVLKNGKTTTGNN